MLRHFLRLRWAPEDPLKCLAGGRKLSRLSPNRARDVILPPQLVQNRAADTRRREGAERESARGVETLERAHQSHCSRADHLIHVRFRGQRARQLPRHVVNETKVFSEKAVARILAAARKFGPKLHIHLCHRAALRSPLRHEPRSTVASNSSSNRVARLWSAATADAPITARGRCIARISPGSCSTASCGTEPA